jgi:hypothetical protein
MTERRAGATRSRWPTGGLKKSNLTEAGWVLVFAKNSVRGGKINTNNLPRQRSRYPTFASEKLKGVAGATPFREASR